jgi:heterodisulfide reductase subunit C
LQTAKTVERLPFRDQEFSKKIIREGITHLERCYQCYACSDACPMAFAMDYYPNQLIHMVRLGFKEKVLKGKTIWV